MSLVDRRPRSNDSLVALVSEVIDRQLRSIDLLRWQASPSNPGAQMHDAVVLSQLLGKGRRRNANGRTDG